MHIFIPTIEFGIAKAPLKLEGNEKDYAGWSAKNGKELYEIQQV